ncbi:MAG: sigma-70 family RNA polymerase sigma factor [Planctomycetota bacterium]
MATRTGPSDTTGLTSFHARRAQVGDADSLAWLVARLSPLLLAQAEFRLGPELRAVCDPEDIVAEAWAIALPRLGELRWRTRAAPVVLRFLCTTIAHRASNLLRQKIRGRAVRWETTAELPASARDALSSLAERERGAALRAALDALGPLDREILVLRGIEQVDNATAAELLAIPPNHAAQRYRRALTRLRRALPGSVFDEIDP